MNYNNFVIFLSTYGMVLLFILMIYTVYVMYKQGNYDDNSVKKLVRFSLILSVILCTIQIISFAIIHFAKVMNIHINNTFAEWTILLSFIVLFSPTLYMLSSLLFISLLVFMALGVMRGNNTKK